MCPPGRNIELNGERKIIGAIENLPLLEWDRMNLVLVYLEEKPCAEFLLWGPSSLSSSEELVEIEKRKNSIVEKLNALGLRVKLLEFEEVTEKGISLTSYVFLVSKKEELLERFEKAVVENDHRARGRLLGYPETAVNAFAQGNEQNCLENYVILGEEGEKRWWLSLPEEERQNLLEEGVMNFLTFRLSWQNWREELETVRWWQRRIQEKAPRVYEDIMRANFWGNKVRGWGDYVE